MAFMATPERLTGHSYGAGQALPWQRRLPIADYVTSARDGSGFAAVGRCPATDGGACGDSDLITCAR